MSELLELFFQKTKSLDQAKIDWLVQWNDIPPLALAKDPGDWGFCITMADVVFGDRFFDFADEVEGDVTEAIMIVARDEFGAPCDLVAWAADGERIASYFGRAAVLGAQTIWPRFDEAVRVHTTVADWLRGGRDGIVIVDPGRATSLLLDAGCLCVSNVSDGRKLREMTTLCPQIVIDAEAL